MIKKLKVDVINTESGTQTRVDLQEDVIADYADLMKGGVKFPPVTVFHDGKMYYLADGFHRMLATVRNGVRDIQADVRKGSCMDALKYALGANTDHGLRRTTADKQKCIQLAISAFKGKSKSYIAGLCGVDDMTVASYMERFRISEPDRVTGKDGKEYPARKPAKAERGEGDAGQERGGKPEIKEGPPSNGLAFAENAILDLEQIKKNDSQRNEAWDLIRRWLDEHE